jgi:hypothetical protein
VYSDAGGVPGTLLTQGSRSGPTNGAWNSVSTATISVTAGTPYWIARLALSGGDLVTRVNPLVTNPDRVDTRFNTALPATFVPGGSWPHLTSMFAGAGTGATPTPTPIPTPTPTPVPTPTPTPPAGGAFTCTQFIGFSVTTSWFSNAGGFQAVTALDQSRYQLMWAGGGAVHYWADPTYPGWTFGVSNPTPCALNSLAPDRVVMDITEDFYIDDPVNGGVARVATDIRNVIATIRSKYPSVRQIYLEPIVGGPGLDTCGRVRAAVNHPYLKQAIDQVIAGGVGFDVRRGPDPTVQNCTQYVDSVGHLDSPGQQAAGQFMGNWYAANAPR